MRYGVLKVEQIVKHHYALPSQDKIDRLEDFDLINVGL